MVRDGRRRRHPGGSLLADPRHLRGYGLWPVLATEGSRRRAVVLGRSPHVFDDLEGDSPWTLTEAVEVAVGPTMDRVTS